MGPPSIPFTIPYEDNLAKIHLERLDLFGECSRVKRHEESRHKMGLANKNPRPVTPKRSAFGCAPPIPKKSRSSSSSSLQLLEGSQKYDTEWLREAGHYGGGVWVAILSKARDPNEPEPPPKNPAGKMPKTQFVLPSNDPMAYSNEHIEREKAAKRSVAEMEGKLARARSQSAANLGAEWIPPVVRHDHIPVAFDASEYQAEMFPRSIHKLRQCGGGKDPKFCRPWQDYEKHREAVWAQDNSMGKSKK